MPTKDKKYISSTPAKNTLKNPFIIYAYVECLLYPLITYDNTEENSFTIKKNVHSVAVIHCSHHMLMIKH